MLVHTIKDKMSYSRTRALKNVALRIIAKLFEIFLRNHGKQYGLLRNLKKRWHAFS